MSSDDEHDRRRRYVHLSENGQKHLTTYLDKISENLWKQLPESISNLDYKHINQLCAKIDDLTQKLDAQSEPDSRATETANFQSENTVRWQDSPEAGLILGHDNSAQDMDIGDE